MLDQDEDYVDVGDSGSGAAVVPVPAHTSATRNAARHEGQGVASPGADIAPRPVLLDDGSDDDDSEDRPDHMWFGDLSMDDESSTDSDTS